MPLELVPNSALQEAKAAQAADPLYKKLMDYKSNYYDNLEQKHKEFTVSLGRIDIQSQHDTATLYSYNEPLHVTFQMINEKFEELTEAIDTPFHVLEHLIDLTQRLHNDFVQLFWFVDRYGLTEDIDDKEWGFGMDTILNIMALKDIKDDVTGKRGSRKASRKSSRKSSRKNGYRKASRNSNNGRVNNTGKRRK